METIRFGFLGIGDIAGRVIPCFAYATGVRVDAAAARELERAQAFAQKWGIPKAYGSYDELFADADIDAVYIGTPHPLHEELVVRALRAGKHVVCEKPMGANAAQVARMIDEARRQKRFLMEANWRRFFPAMTRLRQMVREGALGEIRLIESSCGFYAPWQGHEQARLFNPALGGGAMLDMGIYCLSFTWDMMDGQLPQSILATAQLAPTGVDLQTAMLMQYDNGTIAVGTTAIGTALPPLLRVIGSKGRAELDESDLSVLRYTDAQGKEQLLACPFEGKGYQFEFMAAADCIRAGQLESDISPLQQSLDMARASDEVRRQVGVKYPFDEQEG